jgi:hypothetical protein
MGRSVRFNVHGHGGSYNRVQFLCFLDACEIFSFRKNNYDELVLISCRESDENRATLSSQQQRCFRTLGLCVCIFLIYAVLVASCALARN